jgi:Tol biopolymer transport system component
MNMGLWLTIALSTATAGQISISERGHASNPSWSPDGGWLSFEVNDYSGSVALFVVKIQGDNPVGVPSKVNIPGQSSMFGASGSMTANTTWHPEVMMIFEGMTSGASSRLYFLQPGGAAPAQLLTSGQIGGDLSWPEISPDGQMMAFVSDHTGEGDIYTWDRQSNAVTPAVQSPYSEMAPAYNAYGQMVYSRKNQGGQDLFTYDGSRSAPLIGGNGDQTRPIWADRSVVYFSNERGDEHWDIAVTTNPGQKKTIARDVRLPIRSVPALSSDAKWVAYGTALPEHSSAIYIVSVDGSRTVQINTGLVAVGEPSLIDVSGRTMLAFTALPSVGADWRQLHIMDISGEL